jgi:hypothetical protein
MLRQDTAPLTCGGDAATAQYWRIRLNPLRSIRSHYERERSDAAARHVLHVTTVAPGGELRDVLVGRVALVTSGRGQ